MFCLRSWLPLLFLPLNSPPIFVLCFFTLNYLANRPCLYCSLLLVLLFASSCAWADACFLDLTSNWFEPPRRKATGGSVTVDGTTSQSAVFLAELVSSTAAAFADSAVSHIRDAIGASQGPTATLTALEWLKNLGTKGIRIPCVDVVVRL